MHVAEQERNLPLVGVYVEPAKDYAFKWTILNNLLTITFENNSREPESYLITGIVNQNEFKCRYTEEDEDENEEYIVTFTRLVEPVSGALTNESSPLPTEYDFPCFMTGRHGPIIIDPLIEKFLGAIPLDTKLSLEDCQKILLSSNISLYEKEFIMEHTDFEKGSIWIQHLYRSQDTAPWFFNLQIYGYSMSIGPNQNGKGLDVDYSFYLSKNKKKSKEVWDNVKYQFDLKSCSFIHEKIELSTGDTYRGTYKNYNWELFYCKTWMGYYTIRLIMTPCNA